VAAGPGYGLGIHTAGGARSVETRKTGGFLGYCAELVSGFVLLTRLGELIVILACDSMDFLRSKRVSSEKPPTDLGGLGT
jgi:hypothetical protein